MYLDTGKTKDKYEINVCNNKHKIGIDRVRYHIFYGDEEKYGPWFLEIIIILKSLKLLFVLTEVT